MMRLLETGMRQSESCFLLKWVNGTVHVKAHAQFVSHMLLRWGLMLKLKVGNVILVLTLRGFLHLGCLSRQRLPMNFSPTISSAFCGVCMWSG